MSDSPAPEAPAQATTTERTGDGASSASAGAPLSSVGERLSVASLPIAPTPPALPVGERERVALESVGLTLKGWRLARLLGTGPVTAAYEATRGARDGAAQATVRLMIGNIAKHEQARSHFLRGAYAANRFHHPRVLPITADGTDASGAPFVVRPWTDGEPLHDVIAKGTMSESQVLKLTEQVLDALEMAHSHGVVHGAISPHNLLVTPRASIRLCDFATPPGMGPRQTEEEDILASLRISPWSAPERCSASPDAPSEASDIYALAACMYFAVSQKAPRGAASSPADLARTPARPLRQVAPEVSDSFASIVDHALATEVGRRYESAYAMLGDVRRVLAGRKPKLGEAFKPVPSGSYTGAAAAPASNRRISNPPSRVEMSSAAPQSTLMRVEKARRAAEWKGNVALILAIALLVGVATFVMVREKVDEERDERGAPTETHPR
jgi:serine/threonine protein kinase